MSSASSSKAGRALALGGLLLAGLFGLIQLSSAQDVVKEKEPKDKESKEGKGKEGKDEKPAEKGSEPAVKFKMPAPHRLVYTKDTTSDVDEMKRVIDEKIRKGWEDNKVNPAVLCNDHEFIRRASLDIIGRIATPKEIDDYLKDPPERRRSDLIERLLKHEDYPRHWGNMWTNWLLTRSGDFGRGKYHEQMQLWLEDQFASNKKFHEIVRALIVAKGSNKDSGAVNFILAHLGEATPNVKDEDTGRMRPTVEGQWEMVPITSRITRVFLGTQTQCAQCHPHPFQQSLKQEMFWGVNAFLKQVKREPGPARRPNQRMMILPDLTLTDDESVNVSATSFFETRNGKVREQKAEFLPSGGKEKGPRLDPEKTKGLARREALADYLVEHDMFTVAMANRMWGLFLGRGFVNPIDDFNDNNQPSNPELLKELAARFKHYNYDVKKVIRWITHSEAYHLSHVANVTNDKPEHDTLFSRMVMKALSPEQMFESLILATGAEAADKGNTAAKKRLRDEWLGRLISNFGDDEGNEVNFNGTIVQALLMMNGKDINDSIGRKDKGTVSLAMASSKTPTAVINRLYLSALNRKPSPAELSRIQGKLKLRTGFQDTPRAAYEDLLWALVNSNEFLLNH